MSVGESMICPRLKFVFLHDNEGTSTFIVVCCSLLSHPGCPVVLCACHIWSFKRSVQLRYWFRGGLSYMTLPEGVMGADGDRFELNPCGQTAASSGCTARRWVVCAE